MIVAVGALAQPQLGAVLGLINVMENLSDPSRLGGGIAIAFVSTVYGVGLANLLFYIFGLSAWWLCVLLFKAIYQGYRRLADGDVEGVEPIYRQEKIIRAVGFVMLLAGSRPARRSQLGVAE